MIRKGNTDAGTTHSHKAYSPAGWTANWELLGGNFTSAPTAVSWTSERLDLFGVWTDNGVWHKAWAGSAWTPWERLG